MSRTSSIVSTVGPRFRLGCAALLAALALGGCGATRYLQPVDLGITYGTPVVPVGTHFYFGFVALKAATDAPVHLTSVHLAGVPSGLHVVGAYAVSARETAGSAKDIGYIADLSEASVRRLYPNLRLHPVTDAVIEPGQDLDWYVVVEVAPTRYGEFHTEGLEVAYRADGQDGAITFDGYHIDVRCGPSPGPSPSA